MGIPLDIDLVHRGLSLWIFGLGLNLSSPHGADLGADKDATCAKKMTWPKGVAAEVDADVAQRANGREGQRDGRRQNLRWRRRTTLSEVQRDGKTGSPRCADALGGDGAAILAMRRRWWQLCRR